MLELLLSPEKKEQGRCRGYGAKDFNDFFLNNGAECEAKARMWP